MSDRDKNFISKVNRQKAMDWIMEIATDLRQRMIDSPESNDIEWSFNLKVHDATLTLDDEVKITKESEFDYEVIVKCKRKNKVD